MGANGMTALAALLLGGLAAITLMLRNALCPMTPESVVARLSWIAILAGSLYKRSESRFGTSSPITSALGDLMCAADDCAARIRKYVEVGQ